MINPSPLSSTALSNLPVLPSSAPAAPATARSKTAAQTPRASNAARAASDDGGFARAIKQALSQRANKPAAKPASSPSGGTDGAAAAANAAVALPTTKKASQRAAAASDAETESDGKAPDTAAARPALAEAATPTLSSSNAPASSSDAAAQTHPYGTAAVDATAGLVSTPFTLMGDNSSESAAATSGRQQARPFQAGAGEAAQGQLAAAGPGLAAARISQTGAVAAPVASKQHDTDPGKTTPLPQLQPAAHAGVTPELQASPQLAPADSTTKPAPDGHRAAATVHGLERRNAAVATRDAADRTGGKTAVLASTQATAAGSSDERATPSPVSRPGPGAAMGNNAAAAPALAGIEALTAAVASNASTGAAASTAAAAEGGSVIQAPVSSPGFAAEAGYRLAVMVRDGVTSAQLQLNPAEMGPVTVQIVVDGQTARVHLEAAQADTRQALEAALPQLASNLRDSGLTLTGGGVFDQASQQQNRAADAGNDRSGRQSRGDAGRAAAAAIGVDGPGAASSSSSGVQRRGVVDLVA